MKKLFLTMFLFFFAVAFAWCWVQMQYVDNEWNVQQKDVSEFNWYEWLNNVDSCKKFVEEAIWNEALVYWVKEREKVKVEWWFWQFWIDDTDFIDFKVRENWNTQDWYCMKDNTWKYWTDRNWIYAINLDWWTILETDLK